MIVSDDNERHSVETLYTVIIVRINARNSGRRCIDHLLFNCLAMYRNATINFFMPSSECVYTHYKNTITHT